MNQSKTIEFEEQQYFDDRMYLLYLCAGNVEVEDSVDGAIWTSIYHENPPENHVWCVATYRNIARFPLYRVDSFYKKEDAISYLIKIEPETPLISLGGQPPQNPLQYDEYLEWKRNNYLQDYDWKSLYSVGGTNATERVGQTKEQFKGIK